jgi:transposase
MSDLFGAGGQQLLAGARLALESRARIDSLLRLIEQVGFEVEVFAKLVAGRLREHPGYRAIQVIPGVGPVLAAVFVAEIGDVHRFRAPAQLASWAGLTPKHYESDTTVHRGRITKMGCGGRRRRPMRPTVSNWGGCRVSGGWNRYSSIPVDI